MYLKRVFCLFLAVVMLWIPFTGVSAEEESITVLSGCHTVDAAYPVMGQDQLVKNARSVLLYETTTQSLLYAYNADAQEHPASLTKIMTAILTLEQADLSATVTISEQVAKSIPRDAISIGLQAGEQISVKDLFYAMVVYSANDAAAALAEYIGGNQKDFVQMMNDRALELGCTGTNFENPHGLHNSAQVTTARDICRMLNKALEYPQFQEAFGTIYYTISATNLRDERNVSSNNYLMNTDSVGIHYDGRVTGGRYGITYDGFSSIASTSQSGSMELICIVMGSASLMADDGVKVKSYGGYPETISLLNSVYSNYRAAQVVHKDQVIQQKSVLNGDCDLFIGASDSCSTVVPMGISKEDLIFRYDSQDSPLEAPIEASEDLGTMQIWLNSVCLAETQVYAMNEVQVAYQKTADYQNYHEGFPWWGWLLVAVGLILIIMLTAIFVLRIQSKRKYRMRKSRR